MPAGPQKPISYVVSGQVDEDDPVCTALYQDMRRQADAFSTFDSRELARESLTLTHRESKPSRPSTPLLSFIHSPDASRPLGDQPRRPFPSPTFAAPVRGTQPLFPVKMTFMSMSKSAPMPMLAYPEIEASELKAVRDFLTSYRDEAAPNSPRPRPFARAGERKAPAVSNGITRARSRSSSKSAPNS